MGPTADAIHILSCQFFTKFQKDGYRAVKSWLDRVDIFKKRFVFVPINITESHWFLAVLVNIGMVHDGHFADDDNEKHEHSFCIVLDPLGMDLTTILQPIVDLLNNEAERYGRFDAAKPFNRKTFPIIYVPKNTSKYFLSHTLCKHYLQFHNP